MLKYSLLRPIDETVGTLFQGIGRDLSTPIAIIGVDNRCHKDKPNNAVKLFNGYYKGDHCQHGRFTVIYERSETGDDKTCEYVWYMGLTPEELVDLFSWFHINWPDSFTTSWEQLESAEAVEANLVLFTVPVTDATCNYAQAVWFADELLLKLKVGTEHFKKWRGQWDNSTRLSKRCYLEGIADSLTIMKIWRDKGDKASFEKDINGSY